MARGRPVYCSVGVVALVAAWCGAAGAAEQCAAPRSMDLALACAADDSADVCEALVGVHLAFDRRLHGWASGRAYCLWPGVLCDSGGDVTRLDVDASKLRPLEDAGPPAQHAERRGPGNKRDPTVPPLSGAAQPRRCRRDRAGGDAPPPLSAARVLESVSRLRRLEALSLVGLGLAGPVPAALGELRRLEELHLSENALEGPAPAAAVAAMPRLRALHLDGNALDGGLGALFDAAPQSLERLGLSRNRFVGEIPGGAALARLERLRVLRVGANRLGGRLPADALAALASMRWLGAWGNNLTGPVDALVGPASALERVDVGGNRLGAAAALDVAAPRLRVLYAASNDLDAAAVRLGAAPSLCGIELGFNRRTGAAAAARAAGPPGEAAPPPTPERAATPEHATAAALREELADAGLWLGGTVEDGAGLLARDMQNADRRDGAARRPERRAPDEDHHKDRRRAADVEAALRAARRADLGNAARCIGDANATDCPAPDIAALPRPGPAPDLDQGNQEASPPKQRRPDAPPSPPTPPRAEKGPPKGPAKKERPAVKEASDDPPTAPHVNAAAAVLRRGAAPPRRGRRDDNEDDFEYRRRDPPSSPREAAKQPLPPRTARGADARSESLPDAAPPQPPRAAPPPAPPAPPPKPELRVNRTALRSGGPRGSTLRIEIL
ncbi:hypothetical protein M885DRAFT_541106 [Pelagophyceae sp. CCMP2097]|nr:hypothetical protein M885DRAFT_541106 [Pelagophyceae sp. CCMP2097]